ncbi:BhlA/UviB family holin-like peptide [[Clostridium] polysaccharolyticum]|uniref:BhlA holin family protein n=1 Tax=[Clostridium] polysaccharolyticum TaxID=29364 RepID=A0A1I0A939_9FIRM|nr:BhlA/UviB family holin-like peptide [[Clostridium] polysaccharolyticum]SES90726.1 BhlA holin family protein [[Clostridium] polysaccharolyticum]
MEEVLLSVTQSQGIWTVLFVFLLLYTIKKNDKLDERQEEREQKYQMLLSDLTDKYSLLTSMDKQINNLFKLFKENDKKR